MMAVLNLVARLLIMIEVRLEPFKSLVKAEFCPLDPLAVRECRFYGFKAPAGIICILAVLSGKELLLTHSDQVTIKTGNCQPFLCGVS